MMETLEQIRKMNADDLKTVIRIATRQIGTGIEQGAWDKLESWFKVLDTVMQAPAYSQISPREREELAKDVEKRVIWASYNLIEPGEFVLEKITLTRDINIKGKPYKAGRYKVPDEIDKDLAWWLVEKGFALKSGYERANEV